MRLRLDKLVLSAGLALAMVATSIPAIAGTTATITVEEGGLSLNGKTVTISGTTVADEGAFAEAIKGFVKGGDATVALTGYTGTIKDVPVVTVTENTASSAGETVTNKVTSDGYTLTTATAKAPTIEIAVTNKYTETFTVTVDADADGQRTIDELKTAAEESTDATNHITTLDTLAGKLVQTKDGLKIESLGVATAIADTTGITKDFEKEQKVPVTITKEMKATYTIDSLGASGYTYDFVLDGGANYEYQVYKKTTDNGIVNVSTVDSSVVNSTSDVMFTITDLTGEYYVAKKSISTSGSLLFGDDADEADNTTQDLTVSDTLTVRLGAPTVTEAQKKTFTDLATANGLKVGAYFDATLVGNDTGNAGKLVEINIVKPSDIEALAGEGKTIKYTVLMQHAGMDPVALETTTGSKYITFSSQYFSTFALAYEVVDAETPAENPTEEEKQSQEQQSGDATPAGGSNSGSGSSSENGASSKTADNSMMPLFMTTLLLALCAGSLAIYKEKKTN